MNVLKKEISLKSLFIGICVAVIGISIYFTTQKLLKRVFYKKQLEETEEKAPITAVENKGTEEQKKEDVKEIEKEKQEYDNILNSIAQLLYQKPSIAELEKQIKNNLEFLNNILQDKNISYEDKCKIKINIMKIELIMGVSYYSIASDYQKSISCLKGVIKCSDELDIIKSACYWIGENYFAMKEYDKAEKFYMQALDPNIPSEWIFWMGPYWHDMHYVTGHSFKKLADLYYITEKYELAVELYRIFVICNGMYRNCYGFEDSPDSNYYRSFIAESLLKSAECKKKLDKYQEALTIYQEIISMFGEDWDISVDNYCEAIFRSAKIYIMLGDKNKALSYCELIIEKYQTNPEEWLKKYYNQAEEIKQSIK